MFLLLIDDTGALRHDLTVMGMPPAWRIKEIMADRIPDLRDAAVPPDLLMIDGASEGPTITSIVEKIRAMPGPLASIPVLVVADAEPANSTKGVDAWIVRGEDRRRWLAIIEAWGSPVPLEGVRRLADAFGAAALRPLVHGFREQLIEAIEAIDDKAFETRAHRLAGLAGTLGFADVGAAWLRLSRGDHLAKHDAIRTARLALAAIDRIPEIANE